LPFAICNGFKQKRQSYFNLENTIGYRLAKLQAELFKNDSIIDTIFRPNKNSTWILLGIINAKHGIFLGKKTLVSKYNKKTYSGKCSACKEMCGVNIGANINPIPLIQQLTLL